MYVALYIAINIARKLGHFKEQKKKGKKERNKEEKKEEGKCACVGAGEKEGKKTETPDTAPHVFSGPPRFPGKNRTISC